MVEMRTNFTQADLRRIDHAISQGVLEVEFADGRRVKFSTFDELIARRNFIVQQLGEAAGRQRLKARFTKGVRP